MPKKLVIFSVAVVALLAVAFGWMKYSRAQKARDIEGAFKNIPNPGYLR
jgi:hypothetical protein